MFNNATLSGSPTVTQIDPTINFTWGVAAPAAGVSGTTFSARWTGQIQPLRSDLYTFQADVDGGARLYVNGTKIIDQWNEISQAPTAQLNLVAGQKYAVVFEYFQAIGVSRARLRWGSPSTPIAGLSTAGYGQWYLDVIPQNQLYPPLAAAPAHGLLASYYPTTTFSGAATTQYDPAVSFAWNGAAPASGIPATNFSTRWTGRVVAPSSGSYTFQTVAKDGVRLWINKLLNINRWTNPGASAVTNAGAAVTLAAGQIADLKLDYYGTTGTKLAVALSWKLPGAASFTTIPTASLLPTGDGGGPDVTYDGGLASGKNFAMWQLTDAAGAPQPPAQVAYPPNGLSGVTMMVPSFSPDSKKLVFVDGDTAGGAGWRKGLSTFDFNAATQTFSNRKQLRNTWPLGAVMKWPTFEPDSRSVIFDNSTPGDYCNCTTQYGHMAPTNYYGVPGQLWSIDSSAAAPAAVPLTKANQGELPEDADKSYQPTVLPSVAGGYRWAVFTSTRPYGNLLNVAGTAAQSYSTQIWIAAVDDLPSGAADRSHPAFWLPNQNIQLPGTGQKYTNERGSWALSACVPPAAAGQMPGSVNLCQESADCCGGTASPPTSACQIDVPVASPPVRHCVQTVANMCVPDGAACGSPSDCCNFPTAVCASGVCAVPPPPTGLEYAQATFVRDYVGTCPIGTHVVWRFFDWQTVTPGDSKIVFAARTADTQAALGALPEMAFGMASGAPITTWTGADAGKALLPDPSKIWLRITATLTPTTDKKSTPTLTAWRQSYSCPPSE